MRKAKTCAPLFKVGDHVRIIANPEPDVEEPVCGSVSSVFEAIAGNWAYGVMYDDHTPQERRPFGSAGHSYREDFLEAVPA